MSNLIEAGDGLVDALAGGNTGVTQNALDAWDAAKAAYIEENGVEVDETETAEVEETTAEPGDDPDDGGEGGQAADAPSSPSYF